MGKNGFKVMDSDMHLMEPPDLWQRYIDPEFRDRAPKGLATDSIDMAVEVEGVVIPITPGSMVESPVYSINQGLDPNAKERLMGLLQHAIERGYDAVSQLKAMDDEGLDLAVLFPSRGLMPLGMDGLDPRLAAAIASAYNNWLYDFCQTDPNRLYGAAMVAVQDIELAVGEVRRAVEQLGFRGVFIRPNPVSGRNWHDPYYDPLWAAIQEQGVPLGFHEGGRVLLPQVGGQFESQVLYHTCAQPMQAMLAMVSIIGGGVLERFPRLRVAFLEGNCSWVPWLLWRLREEIGSEAYGGPYHPRLTMEPIDYFKRQCYISVEPDEDPAIDAIGRIGDDNILFSTDYPHLDSKYPHAVDHFLEQPLPEETKRKILWDNCARFYGFD